MSSNAALKRKEQLEEILNVRGRATPTKKQQEEVTAKDSRFANIQSNPFFQAVFLVQQKTVFTLGLNLPCSRNFGI